MRAFVTYAAARAEAQRLADRMQMDVGVEAPLEHLRPGVSRLPAHLRTWNIFLLPSPAKRQGHELRCEGVRPEWRSR